MCRVRGDEGGWRAWRHHFLLTCAHRLQLAGSVIEALSLRKAELSDMTPMPGTGGCRRFRRWGVGGGGGAVLLLQSCN